MSRRDALERQIERLQAQLLEIEETEARFPKIDPHDDETVLFFKRTFDSPSSRGNYVYLRGITGERNLVPHGRDRVA